MKCPHCKRNVGPEHFACVRAAKAGGAGHGKAKARGDAEYYRALVAQRKDRQETGPNTGLCGGTPSAGAEGRSWTKRIDKAPAKPGTPGGNTERSARA